MQLKIRPIVQYPSTAVLKACAAFEAPYDGALSLIEDLKWACASGNGVGLAANQIGDLRRAIVYVGNDRNHHGLINPVIVDRSEDTDVAGEGCLSLPGINIMVRRSREIRVDAIGENLEPVTLVCEGQEARIIQHEIDHLNGVLITDHNGRLNRQMTLDKWLKNYNKHARRVRGMERKAVA